MWKTGNQKVNKLDDYNEILEKVLNDKQIDDFQARCTLAAFLRSNIGLAFELLSGVKLLPFQEIVLKGMFLADNTLFVAGRGCSKSFIISVFSLLYPIFYPGSRLGIISANFRSARRIIDYSEKMLKSRKAGLLQACYTGSLLKRGNDEYKWKLPNGSEVIAVPLSGDQIRGYRFDAVLCDEGLLISKDIQESIIRPFLTVKRDFQEQQEVKEAEDFLIKQGALEEKDRITFPKNKYMVFSSASYEFEYLYEMFVSYCQMINKPPPEDPDPARHFVIRMSYEAMPEDGFIDATQINAAKASFSENSDHFKKEYRALFSKMGDGYFNPKKMHDCTCLLGDYPTIQIRGEKGSHYILAIDPSYSSSKSSDFFAMGLYLLIPQERRIVLVNSYARAGGTIKEHFEYLTYILTFFDIRFVVFDSSGSEFIDGYNNSSIAKERNINIQLFSDEVDFDAGNETYMETISKAKREYNVTSKRFAYGQRFSSDTIRTMNEHLQNQIDSKKVWFASPICPNNTEFSKAVNFEFPFTFVNNKDQEYNTATFLEDQDSWIRETKNQTALITVKSTSLGTLTFELPQSIRRSDSPDRPRKDLYTCLLMANYIAKHYYNMMFSAEVATENTFTPILI